jgi:hypothetical protein
VSGGAVAAGGAIGIGTKEKEEVSSATVRASVRVGKSYTGSAAGRATAPMPQIHDDIPSGYFDAR